MKERDELKWIRKIKLFGSKKEADYLVRFYYDEIYKYVYQQLSGNDDTYDLTQEIFISMLRSIKTYKKEQASFRTWLYHIATNKVIDYRRRKTPQTITLDEIDITDENDFIRQIEQSELLLKIERYVSCFPPTVQQIYRLHVYGDFTFAQIALSLNISEATAKSHYYRLQKKVKKEFYNDYRDIIGS